MARGAAESLALGTPDKVVSKIHDPCYHELSYVSNINIVLVLTS